MLMLVATTTLAFALYLAGELEQKMLRRKRRWTPSVKMNRCPLDSWQ
jgi:hypothetical protein